MWLVRKALRRHGRAGAWKEERSHGRRVRLHHRLHPSADRQLDYQFQSASADATDDAVTPVHSPPRPVVPGLRRRHIKLAHKGIRLRKWPKRRGHRIAGPKSQCGRRSQESRRGLQSRAIGRSNRNPRARSLAPEQLLAFRRRLSVNHSSKPLAFPRRLPPFQRPQSLRRLLRMRHFLKPKSLRHSGCSSVTSRPMISSTPALQRRYGHQWMRAHLHRFLRASNGRT